MPAVKKENAIISEKILIAEDEYLIRWSLSQALSEQGYKVFSVENGKKALEVLETQTFDFIITDLFMPEMDGWKVLETVQQNWPKLRVIIMTAHGKEEIKKKAKEKGAWAYVEKPFLIDAISDLLKAT
jgi:DNA-binding NtrC family response regulator